LIGAVLAGGRGSRLGQESKPAALLDGRPLVLYPLEALAAVCDRVAVVCKSNTRLPDLGPAERWDEPDEPQHPLAGIVHALERAQGEPVLVCAADMPFVTAEACRSLIRAQPKAQAIIAVSDSVLQPTFALYAPQALPTLKAAPPNTALTKAVEELNPTRVAFPAHLTQSINTPQDLADAQSKRAGA
jgi:molybdopterin-guanine dinucleotide biosynthesis protein A